MLIRFFRKLFRYNDKFRVRVTPFDRDISYYSIQYKEIGYFKKWKRLEEAYIQFNSPHLWSLNQPVLIANFDKAVEYAKTLTVDKIKEHYKNEYKKYKEELTKVTEQRNKRYKIKEIIP